MDLLRYDRQELENLLHLPSTAELREKLERLEFTVREGKPHNLGVAGMNHAISSVRREIELAERRDEVAATRPDGCECLGIGWVYEASETPNSYDLDKAFVRKYCPCPEGIAAKAEAEQRAKLRRARDVESFIERAEIPSRFAGLSFDSARPGELTDRLRAWSGAGLFLFGNYGRGKTGYAVSVLKSHIERKCVAGLFLSVPDLLDAIRATYDHQGEETAASLMARAKGHQMTVFDDIGAEKPSEWVTEKLYQIVNHRHGHELPTIFTSNLSLEELAPRIGERTCWRIVEMCDVVEVEGPNLRDRA